MFVNDLYSENNLGAGTALPAGNPPQQRQSDNTLIAFLAGLNYFSQRKVYGTVHPAA